MAASRQSKTMTERGSPCPRMTRTQREPMSYFDRPRGACQESLSRRDFDPTPGWHSSRTASASTRGGRRGMRDYAHESTRWSRRIPRRQPTSSMPTHAETMLERLEIPYRRKLLAAGDTGFSRKDDLRPEGGRLWGAPSAVVQQSRRLPGAAGEHPVPTGEGREAPVRPHLERVLWFPARSCVS